MIAGALAVGVPCLWWTVNLWGAVGATAVWVLHGVSDITLGLWLMHKRLLPGELIFWYRKVIFLPFLIIFPFVLLWRWAMPVETGRVSTIIWLGSMSMSLLPILIAFARYNLYNARSTA
jgi:hypothetical protein